MKDIFEMVGYHNLLDLNAQTIGQYLKNLCLEQFIVRDCTLSDKLLTYLMRGIGKDGSFKYLWEISLDGRHIEMGPRVVEMLIEIIRAKDEEIAAQKRRDKQI